MVKHLNLLITPHEPWLYNISGTNCHGVLCNLLTYLTMSLNFTYDFVKGWKYFDSNQNKSLNGAVSQYNTDN